MSTPEKQSTTPPIAAADPLNHDSTLEYMEEVPSVLPGTDFIWYRHFLAELYDPDRSVYAKELEQGDPPAMTLMHDVEYNKNASFGLKTTEGEVMKPSVLGMDNVEASKSRLKMADDLTIARYLVAWMHAQGRGAYYDAYLGVLEKLPEHRGPENEKGMHAYISYQCTQKGEPDAKSYIFSELYHRAR
ncbi:hypothetical protein DL767_000609 [Monosporascus sp. MG133]|nr:hypothetical protein DL767_000609 [Monosporascus sp. MG133]